MSLEGILQRIQEIENRFGRPKETDGTVLGDNQFNDIFNRLQQPSTEKSDTGSHLQQEIERIIQQQSENIGLDPNLIKAVVKAESAFNPQAVSKAGAQGLMQLMPKTAEALGVDNPLNISENIRGGSKYLKGLVQKYQSLPLALAAYNAGPGNVEKYGGVPPFKETQNYIKRVLNFQQQFDQQTTVGGAD